MNLRAVFHLISYVLLVMGLAMAGCAGLAFGLREEPLVFRAFLVSGGVTLAVGAVLAMATRGRIDLSRRDGFGIVVFGWLSAAVCGALPFGLTGVIAHPVAALFETMSGFTTTGATILIDIEIVPRGLLFWRSMTHWLGGMGIIVLTLAILPILGVGGMQLFIAEAPGTTPNRLHPRITETAKRLWGIYMILTFIQTLLLMFGGMDLFDALCHAFSTMATGGFSTQNDSITGYSPYIQYVIVLFMIIAGTSFSLHYFLLKGQFDKVLGNEELRFYLSIIGVFTLIIAGGILLTQQAGIENAFRDSLFQVVSIATTTGFITTDYLQWHGFLWFLLFVLMFTGGCIGSTGGGIKMIRILVLAKNTRLELKRLIHPMAVIPVRLNNKAIPGDIIQNFLAFFLLYMLIIVAGSGVMTIFGLDFTTAIGAATATLGNIGPAIGKLGAIDNYAFIPNGGKWMLSFFMLIGRLELFTVLLLFSPSFWKH